MTTEEIEKQIFEKMKAREFGESMCNETKRNVLRWVMQQLQKPNVSISLPNYEYEMLIDDEGTPFEINSWIPITTDRIKDPSRIDEYIAKGLIRKRQ